MSRNGNLSFMRNLTTGAAVTVNAPDGGVHVLRDVILATINKLSRSIPRLTGVPGNGIYEHRENLLRTLDRLDCRPNMTAGRSKVLINDLRLSVGEVSSVDTAIREVYKLSDSELKITARNSELNIQVAKRRDIIRSLGKLFNDDVSIDDSVTDTEAPQAANPV